MSHSLSGKTALVTGGASGIGLATSTLLCERGAKVAINYLPADSQAADTVDRLRAEGLDVIHAPGDVSDPGSVDQMVRAACDALGRLDMLVNNAARGTPAPVPFEQLDEMTEELWEKILSTNLVGPFRCARAAAPALKSTKGAIVNVASIAGFGIRGSSVAYAASKAGLVNLTISLARALAPDVRVNAVAPGLVDTPWINSWTEERKALTKQQSLLRRLAQPSDVADVIVFLLAGTTYMNAQTLIVDGGRG